MGVIVLNVMVSWLFVISMFIICANFLKYIYIALFDQPFSAPVRQTGKPILNTSSQVDNNMQRVSGESYYRASRTAPPSHYPTAQNTYKGSAGSYNTPGTYNSGSLAYASNATPKSYEEYRKTHKISR